MLRVAIVAMGIALPGAAATMRHDTGRSGEEVAVRPLRTNRSVPFLARGERFAFRWPPRCHSDGGFIVVPARPDYAAAAAEASKPMADRSAERERAVHVSGDGKKKTVLDPTTILGLEATDSSYITSMSALRNGHTYLLVHSTRRGRPAQHLVEFDSKGKAVTKIEVELADIRVQEFAVFGTGDFLLMGVRHRPRERRLSVMPAQGGSMRDVLGLPHDLTSEPQDGIDEQARPLSVTRAVTGGDGRVHLLSPSDGGRQQIYVMTPDGLIEEVLLIDRTTAGADLVDVHVSNGRLAAVYNAAGPGGASSWRIDVHDLNERALTAAYGPIPQPVLCYDLIESKDTFILLAGSSLDTASP